MRRLLIALPVLVVALAVPAVALAGGWATVGLSSTPEGTPPGKTWVVDMTILQHGRTPLENVKPAVTIVNGDARETFAAKPTGKPGVYRAEVVFPTAGSWNYQVDDGFISGQPHTFPAVEIGAPASAPASAATTSDDGGPSMLWLGLGVALLLLAAAVLLLRDRRRPRPHQPQAA